MKDPLKKYTEENREAFEDFEQPDFDALWGSISEELDSQETKVKKVPLWAKSFPYIKVAAMLLLCAGLGWVLWQTNKQPVYGNEWAETKAFYHDAIEYKMQALEARREQIDPRIFEDLSALDNAMSELRTDLKDQADNEEVINAMIRNYQIKLKILEEILEELKEYESNKNDTEKGEDPRA